MVDMPVAMMSPCSCGVRSTTGTASGMTSIMPAHAVAMGTVGVVGGAVVVGECVGPPGVVGVCVGGMVGVCVGGVCVGGVGGVSLRAPGKRSANNRQSRSTVAGSGGGSSTLVASKGVCSSSSLQVDSEPGKGRVCIGKGGAMMEGVYGDMCV